MSPLACADGQACILLLSSATLTPHTQKLPVASQLSLFSPQEYIRLHNMFDWLSRRHPNATTTYSRIDTGNVSVDNPTLHGNKKRTTHSFRSGKQATPTGEPESIPCSSCKNLDGKLILLLTASYSDPPRQDRSPLSTTSLWSQAGLDSLLYFWYVTADTLTGKRSFYRLLSFSVDSRIDDTCLACRAGAPTP